MALQLTQTPIDALLNGTLFSDALSIRFEMAQRPMGSMY